jgi:hypothetical membrane protein
MPTRTLALAGIVGPVAFAVAAVAAGAVNGTAYSPVHSFVSELAAVGSDARVLMTIGFFVLGLSLLVFAYAVGRAWRGAVLLALVIALSGAGTLMAGTFSCDQGCPTSGDRSTHQQLHDTSSVITFSAWIVAPFLAAGTRRRTRYGRASIVLGVLALGGGLVMATYATDRQPDDPVGLLQRSLLAVVGVWFVVTALELRRTTTHARDAGERFPIL